MDDINKIRNFLAHWMLVKEEYDLDTLVAAVAYEFPDLTCSRVLPIVPKALASYNIFDQYKGVYIKKPSTDNDNFRTYLRQKQQELDLYPDKPVLIQPSEKNATLFAYLKIGHYLVPHDDTTYRLLSRGEYQSTYVEKFLYAYEVKRLEESVLATIAQFDRIMQYPISKTTLVGRQNAYQQLPDVAFPVTKTMIPMLTKTMSAFETWVKNARA